VDRALHEWWVDCSAPTVTERGGGQAQNNKNPMRSSQHRFLTKSSKNLVKSSGTLQKLIGFFSEVGESCQIYDFFVVKPSRVVYWREILATQPIKIQF